MREIWAAGPSGLNIPALMRKKIVVLVAAVHMSVAGTKRRPTMSAQMSALGE
jgi:hypothetical protein